MKARRSNFEVLRIICTLMIVAFHYIFYGGAGLSDDSSLNCFTSEFIYHLGELGVNCFVLISGYFMAETIFKPKKIVLMMLQIEFYVLLCKAILILLGEQTSWELLQFFPMLRNGYWFVHAYLLLYALIPFLKKMLVALEQKELLSLIISQVFIWSVIPSVLLVSLFHYPSTESMPFYNRYIWLILIYTIGYYLRQYGLPEFKSNFLHIKESKPWMVAVLPYELLILFILFGERGLWPYSPTFFRMPNSILMLCMSLALFCPFITYEPDERFGKLIRSISSCSLGIYLFHDGELRLFLWNKVFPYVNTDNWFYYFGQVLYASVLVFAAGLVIEIARQTLEKKILYPLVGRIELLLQRRNTLD